MRVIDPLSVTNAISRIGSPQRRYRSGEDFVNAGEQHGPEIAGTGDVAGRSKPRGSR